MLVGFMWGFTGLGLAVWGVYAIVKKELELGGEGDATPTILRGLSAVVAGGIITALGIGLLLIAVLAIAVGPSTGT